MVTSCSRESHSAFHGHVTSSAICPYTIFDTRVDWYLVTDIFCGAFEAAKVGSFTVA